MQKLKIRTLLLLSLFTTITFAQTAVDSDKNSNIEESTNNNSDNSNQSNSENSENSNSSENSNQSAESEEESKTLQNANTKKMNSQTVITIIKNEQNDNVSSNSDSESDSNSDSNSEAESESESEQVVEIEKVFNFAKKSLGGRKINTDILHDMCKKYYADGKSYENSIQLFQNDMNKKIFTEVH